MPLQSQSYTACSTGSQGRVEQYFHICDAYGQTTDSGDTPCIVLEFSRYRHADGRIASKTVTWHGPYWTRQAAIDLIGLLQPQPPIDAADATSNRKAEAKHKSS